MRQLIEGILVPTFDNELLAFGHDGAVTELPPGKLAFTTDSYVVRPLVFPGGDIGSLAVNGTVNDLAMCGARPLLLSCGLILEEGLPTETLVTIAQSMRAAADAVGVSIVTGDTKVVDRGKGDGIYINTAGVGIVASDRQIGPSQIRCNDVVLVSGEVGRHGMAVMTVREGMSFENEIESDCAPLVDPVLGLLEAEVEVHCLRDLTRGGLGGALIEIAETRQVQIDIEEGMIPVPSPVRGACEILGIDPFFVACEGRLVAFVPAADAGRALAVLQAHGPGLHPARIGVVSGDGEGLVRLRSQIGTQRIAVLPSGEQLPRIC
jgi:hydrogenase expression/formation protein HypE